MALADTTMAVETNMTIQLCRVNTCLLFFQNEAIYASISRHTIKPIPPKKTKQVEVISSVALLGGMMPLSKRVTPGALQNEAIAWNIARKMLVSSGYG